MGRSLMCGGDGGDAVTGATAATADNYHITTFTALKVSTRPTEMIGPQLLQTGSFLTELPTYSASE